MSSPLHPPSFFLFFSTLLLSLLPFSLIPASAAEDCFLRPPLLKSSPVVQRQLGDTGLKGRSLRKAEWKDGYFEPSEASGLSVSDGYSGTYIGGLAAEGDADGKWNFTQFDVVQKSANDWKIAARGNNKGEKDEEDEEFTLNKNWIGGWVPRKTKGQLTSSSFNLFSKGAPVTTPVWMILSKVTGVRYGPYVYENVRVMNSTDPSKLERIINKEIVMQSENGVSEDFPLFRYPDIGSEWVLWDSEGEECFSVKVEGIGMVEVTGDVRTDSEQCARWRQSWNTLKANDCLLGEDLRGSQVMFYKGMMSNNAQNVITFLPK